MLSGMVRNTGAARLCFVKVDDGRLTFDDGNDEAFDTFVEGSHRVLESTGATTDTCLDAGAEAPWWESMEIPDGASVTGARLLLDGSERPSSETLSRLELDAPVVPMDDGDGRTSFSGTLRNTGTGVAITPTITVAIVLVDSDGNVIDRAHSDIARGVEVPPGETIDFETTGNLRASGLTPDDYRVFISWEDPRPDAE